MHLYEENLEKNHMTNQVKSRKRVVEHGEVFTAEREVKAMCDLVSDECLRIDSRFLEPACGNGNFLSEILARKLDVVEKKYKRSPADYEKNALLALGSLYGVELLFDNVKECRHRLFALWDERYSHAIKKDRKESVRDSARYILEKNIICGNALSLHEVDSAGQDTDRPIIFSQWAFVTGPMVKREDYTFEELLADEAEPQSGWEETMFDFTPKKEQEEGKLIKVYPPIPYWRLKEYE